jgi:dolichyl-phosphate-mannose--protein O-mannosyl transferase
VYVLTFLPWFQRGYDLSEWVRLQQSMAAETAQHTGEHNPYLYENDYRAFLWFIKPVAYVDFTMEGERAVIFAGISNPLVWLLTLPAMIWVALRAAREKVPDGWLLVALFLATYLPFALTTRPQWAHSALSVLPFCVAAIAWALRMRWLPGRELWIYLAAVVIVSLPLYLLAIGAGYEIPLLRSIIEIYRPSYGH